MINQVIIQPFLNLYDHLVIPLPVPMISCEGMGTFGPCTCKRAEKNLLATRWRLPCPVQKQVGIKCISDISIPEESTQYAVSLFQLISAVGPSQSFPTCKDFFTDASYRSRWQHRLNVAFNWPVSIAENWKFPRTVLHGEFALRPSLWFLWPLHLET